MKSAVIVFPGSNCDRDVVVALEQRSGRAPQMVWHRDTDLPAVDMVVLPGGFSYGDYLRCGAMAAQSPVMRAVRRHAEAGGLVLGICNGFQILAEARLVPGVLLRNKKLRFICKDMHLKVANNDTVFTRRYAKDATIRVPIAHAEGNYFVPPDQLKALQDNNQIVFRYATPDGVVSEAANENGALDNIAGVINDKGNVMGMMPHPERVVDPLHGGTDGVALFDSILGALA